MCAHKILHKCVCIRPVSATGEQRGCCVSYLTKEQIMKAAFVAKKAEIVNRLAKELLEVNKQLVLQRPQQAAKAIVFFNKKTTELMDKVAVAATEAELNNLWLDYSVVMAGYIVSHDLLIDID